MSTLAFQFIARRYHATPWGHVANEGLVEWPPSPWRIIRALLAVGFVKRGWQSVPDDARRLVETLATVDPLFRLPPAVASHLRHWMPVRGGKTRVLDSFLAVHRTPVLVHYPLHLDDQLQLLLESLVRDISYLGRTESWVEGGTIQPVPDLEPSEWCRPVQAQDDSKSAVRLLAPMSPSAYAAWRAVAGHTERIATKRRRRAGEAPRPPDDLMDCLLTDTSRLQREGWSNPPGTRWVLYTQPEIAMAQAYKQRIVVSSAPSRVEAVLLTITPAAEPGGDGRRGVRPLLSRAVPQAELLHQAAVSQLGEAAPRCPEISGRAPDGGRLRGHRHAHYMPIDIDGDNRIDHVLVYAPGGLNHDALAALARVPKTWTKRQVGCLAVRMIGKGSVPEIRDHLGTDHTRRRRLSILGRSRVWTSVTPFVPPRHIKRTRHTLEDQIRDELTSRGLPSPVRVELLEPWEVVQRRLFGFVLTRREGKPQPPARVSFGVRLTFGEPVSGPLALGYASHYGLGLFGANMAHDMEQQ